LLLYTVFKALFAFITKGLNARYLVFKEAPIRAGTFLMLSQKARYKHQEMRNNGKTQFSSKKRFSLKVDYS